MKYRSILVGVTVVAAMFWGCGGKETPTTPKAPEITTQTIAITTSSDMLHIGKVETLSATATMSDGTTKTVMGGIWGTDAPGVATVESTGRMTIVGSGMATVYVDYQGKRGTKLLRGLPNYQGAWSGSYAIVSCSSTGDFYRMDFNSNFPANSVWPTNFNLIQDEDRVTGRFYLGTLGADGSGPIQVDGQLLFEGAIHEGDFTIEVSWRMQSTTAGRITGTVYEIWRCLGVSGDGRVSANIRDLNRTSTAGMAGTPGMPAFRAPTLEGLLRAIRGR